MNQELKEIEPMVDLVGEHYLGDGLYVSFDGMQVILRAPRADGDHHVALEPEVWSGLLRWHRELLEKMHEDLRAAPRKMPHVEEA